MRHVLGSAFAFAALAASAVSADVPAGVVKLEARHKHVLPPHKKLTRRRTKRQSVNAPLDFNGQWVPQGGYFIDVEIGTPAQKFEVLLDTGSSNLYVPKSTARTCEAYLCPGGSFVPEDSSTFTTTNAPAPFNISYTDGSTVNGTFVADKVTVSGATLSKYVFSLAEQLQVSPHQQDGPQYGIMGVGPEAGEASYCASQYVNVSCTSNFTTPTVYDALYSAGKIKSRSYSLYLDDLADQKGSILFGGIDTAKYTGDLVPLGIPTEPSRNSYDYGAYDYNYVILKSMSGKFSGKTTQLTPSNYTSTLLIDSGNPRLDLPTSVFNALAGQLPSSVQVYQGSPVIACKDAANVDASLSATLSGTNGKSVTIEMPFINFVYPMYTGDYNSTTSFQMHGEDFCGIAIGSGGDPVFGDPFLRSAYAFFDMDAHTISVAQASYDSKSSSITPVGPGQAPSPTGTGTNTAPAGPGSSSGSAPSASSSTSGAVIVKGESAFFFAMFAAASMVAYLW